MLTKKKKEFNWKNPYIDLADNLSERLIVARTPDDYLQCAPKINQYITQYDRVIIEPGSGSGIHLIDQAKKSPTTLFIGFELRYKRACKTIIKAERDAVSNLLVVIADAGYALSQLPENSLHGAYINFPDPWDKRRWNKHRLFNENFILYLGKALKQSGFLLYKTDHKEYFCEVEMILKQSELLKTEFSTYDLYNSDLLEGNVATEFERLFISKGQPICMLKAIKV